MPVFASRAASTTPGRSRRAPGLLARVLPASITAVAAAAALWVVAMPAGAAPRPAACACVHTLFGFTSPAVADSGDAGANVELGVKFVADRPGLVRGVRFFKSAANTGTHTGSLWSATGTRLATATFSHETAAGWQFVAFRPPVVVTAGTTYVASYHTTTGHYAATHGAFTAAFDRPPLHVPASGVSGGNGVFAYGPSAFPNQTFEDSNYWVDVVFTTCRHDSDHDDHGHDHGRADHGRDDHARGGARAF